jgi:hypothetical protein
LPGARWLCASANILTRFVVPVRAALEGEMKYAKALAVGVAIGLLAVVLQVVVGFVSMMLGAAAQGGGGGVAGLSVDPVPGFVVGFLVGSLWTLWRARLRTQTS